MTHNVQAPRRPAPVLANDSIEKAMIDEYYLPGPGAGWSELYFITPNSGLPLLSQMMRAPWCRLLCAAQNRSLSAHSTI
jgi:hypothetical protein